MLGKGQQSTNEAENEKSKICPKEFLPAEMSHAWFHSSIEMTPFAISSFGAIENEIPLAEISRRANLLFLRVKSKIN
jgi:hypothetical protein